MSYQGKVVIIPVGLEDLLKAVTKAVIKYQPDSNHVFAASFSNELIFITGMPVMPLNELVKEFSVTNGCHFYRKNNKDLKQQPQDTVRGCETFPDPKPILERGTHLLLRKNRCEDLRESFPLVPSDQNSSSQDIQSMDTATCKSKDQTEVGQQVFANPIVLTPGPILDIKDMDMYCCRIDPNPSPLASPPLSSINLSAGVCSALSSDIFERVSLSELNPEVPAALIRTGVFLSESLIVVKTESVPDIIVFLADHPLTESAVVAPPPGAFPLSAKSSSTSMLAALAAGPTLEAIHPISDDTTAPVVETQEVVVSEPEEYHDPKVTPVTLGKHMETPSVPDTTLEIPGFVLTVSPSPVELQGPVPAQTVQEVEIYLSKDPVQEMAGESTGMQYPLSLATSKTECVSVILPHLAAVESQASTETCPPTAETVDPEPSSGICHSAMMVKTKSDSANLPGPAAVTLAQSSNVTCPTSGTDIMAPVPPCLPVSSAPSVQLLPPVVVPPLTEEVPAALIRTGVFLSESLIVVKTESVPDIVMFLADHLLTESAVVAPPPGAFPLSAKSSSTSMLVALAAGPTLETLHSISDDTTAPVVKPEEYHNSKVRPVTPVKSLETPSVPDTTLEIPGLVPAVSLSPVELQGSVPAKTVQGVEINLSKDPVQEVAGESTGMHYPLPLATSETEYVSVILPHPAAVESQASTQACPPTAETMDPEPSSGICHSSMMVETKSDSANLPGPAAVTPAQSSNVRCPTSGTDILAPVPPCLPVVSSAPSVQLLPPFVVPPLTEETLSSSAPAGPSTLMASGEYRSPILLYLPLSAPELMSNPGLLCQLGLGPEEANSLSVLFLTMTSAQTPVTSSGVAASPPTANAAPSAAKELPRSFVTNLPGVTDTPRKQKDVTVNTDERQEEQRTQSNLFYTNGLQEPQRTDGYVASIPEGLHNPSCSAVCQDTCFHCPCNISLNNVHSPAAKAFAGSMCCPFSVNPQGGAALGYGTHSPGHGTYLPGHCPASLEQQASMAQNSHGLRTNVVPVCSSGHSLCGRISHSGSHWRFCHLTQPESQGRISCPNQNSLNMMHCNGLECLANPCTRTLFTAPAAVPCHAPICPLALCNHTALPNLVTLLTTWAPLSSSPRPAPMSPSFTPFCSTAWQPPTSKRGSEPDCHSLQ
ncbi:hypothetical protein UPYG_G00291560 [Umbra pygmaea]|uniref:Uncharacterized protein n=1 Tax=Umbra pygmaea TaxID=75934 RepID=A0ABD0W6G5_UMBPY